MDKKPRVLIITYYWPPSGGSGVQRWLKMSKYLPEFGVDPVIFTPSNGEAPVIDHSLESDVHPEIEVLKNKIWEPFGMYKKFTGKKNDERVGVGFLNESKKKSKLKENLAIWVRGNFFIPDARKFWIKPSVQYLRDYLKDNQIDLIISTGPPHSTHLIAREIKRIHNIPWIADFRDPWTKIDFYDKLKLSNWADKKHKSLERSVLKEANLTVSVSPSWEEDLKSLGAENTALITNGYDPSDMPTNTSLDMDTFSITHIGSMNEDRNPHGLWKVLSDLVKTQENFNKKLKIRIIGKTDVAVFDSLKEHGLTEYLDYQDYMPHAKVIRETFSSQVLLLAINDAPNVSGIIPGKLFEYIASGRPILALGPPNSDSGRIIKKLEQGYIANFTDLIELKRMVMELFENFSEGKIQNHSVDTKVYSRKYLAGCYAKEIRKILN